MDVSLTFQTLVIVFFALVSGDINYVKPHGLNGTECPDEPCLTLDAYTNNTEKYFIANTTFVFLSGVHRLEFNLSLENLTDIALYGSYDSPNTTQIIFNPLVWFKWIDSKNISITNLVIIVSGTTDSEAFFYNLYFLGCMNIRLSEITFLGENKSVYSSALRCHTGNITITNCTFSKCSGLYGGGIIAYLCSIYVENTIFIKNRAKWGGAMYLYTNWVEITGQNTFFNNTAAIGGGVMYLDTSWVEITGQNTFFNNTAGIGGGAILDVSSMIEIKGTTFFVGNSAKHAGGALSSQDNIRLRIMENTWFINNSVRYESGGALLLVNSTAELIGNIRFQGNSARYHGGGIYIYYYSTLFGVNISFTNNSMYRIGFGAGISCGNNSQLHLHGAHFEGNKVPKGAGGGLISFLRCSVKLENTSMIHNHASIGGAIAIECLSTLTLTGINYFAKNIATHSGGSVSFYISSALLMGENLFSNNSALIGGAIILQFANITVNGSVSFINNTGQGFGGSFISIHSSIMFQPTAESHFVNNRAKVGGAIYGVEKVSLILTGSHSFVNNSAYKGGAIALLGNSKLSLVSPLSINFTSNQAEHTGGALFFDDPISTLMCNKSTAVFNIGHCYDPAVGEVTECKTSRQCPFELESSVPFNASLSNITLTFVNNTVGRTGTILHGGYLDNCRVYLGGGHKNDCGNRVGGYYSENPIEIFQSISAIDNETLSISSDPMQVCFCKNSTPDCTLSLSIQTVTGRKFTVSVITVSQGNFPVPSSVRVSLDTTVQLDRVQNIQQTYTSCTDIHYRVYSAKDSARLVMYPEGPCRDIGIARREINITLLPCPEGFVKSGSECICEERLQVFTTNCSVDDSSIERNHNNFWVEALYVNQTYSGLVIHPVGCPFEYCIDIPIRVTLDNPDVQCDHNHSGILCGSCKENFSVALGSLHCLPCSNAYLSLILPFTMAGIALVAFLLLMRLTVVGGMLNGLIFYANTVQVNRHIFFPLGETNILTIFISWLNLDLGIETCFYDGMDVYAYTWFQYLFPFYVWFLIGFIIVLCRYSLTVSRTLGKYNPVAVLSTLILLSYGKILQAIIASLSYTVLEYPENAYQHVWLYSGDVSYFKDSKHITLGVFSILALLFLFFPYTLIMLIGHKLIAHSNRPFLSWLNRIMPFLDSYYAPHKKEYRYWTGVLLLIRCALFLTFALNALGSASVNLIAITSVTAGLLVMGWLRNKLYIKLYNDILDASFILNLCVFSAATYHVKETGESQAGLAYTSVGIAFTTFIGIFSFHIYLLLKDTAAWQKIVVTAKKMKIHWQAKSKDISQNNVRTNDKQVRNQRSFTTSVIDLNQIDVYTA